MPRRERKSSVAKVAALFTRTRARSLSGMLEYCGDNSAINKRFASEQSCFAGARIVGRPSHEIEGACNATGTVPGPQITYVMTNVQPGAVIIERVCRASVSSDQRGGGKTERHKPVRVFLSHMQRRGPDRTLVPQNVFQELSFKRWCRRRLWCACRRLPRRRGDAGEEDN